MATPKHRSPSPLEESGQVPVIELQDLCVRLGNRPILNQLRGSLTGNIVGLLGPNGAGKTTLLRTLLGFFSASSGDARVLGHSLRSEGRHIRALVGYMPEDDAHIAGMTAIRWVRFLGELSGCFCSGNQTITILLISLNFHVKDCRPLGNCQYPTR